jgi:curli biogenesis system outer membrane secretion channel CsgG
MLMKMIKYLLLALIVLMTGCAQKVQVKALNPAEVGEMASKKKVAITAFQDDRVGLSGKIEAQIAKHKLDQKRYFTVLSRNDLDKVMREQKLQSSELMDEKTATKIGKLVGAQALINGQVTTSGKNGSYQEARERCLKYYKDSTECARWKHYNVTCKTTQAGISASINIVDMENGSIIYADTITKDYNGDSCKDGTFTDVKIPTKDQALQGLANQISNEFVYKLTPHYVTFSVGILDSIEFEVNDKQAASFENALAFLKDGRSDKAEQIMNKVNESLNGQSYVVAYNLGVINESRVKFDDAKKLYAMADSLAETPVEEINAAVIRIDSLIAKRDKAKEQMNR